MAPSDELATGGKLEDAVDIAEWLRGLGLEKYAPAFDENAINWDVLSELTTDDLKEIGVAAVGDRRRLLAAIATLGEGALPAAPTPVRSSGPGEAERRQLTVMFCDLVGSTALGARLDPEDLREVIAAYHRAVAGVVSRFDGFVAKYMGDGVLMYFGYPSAHEDDAERAIRAGLGIIEAVRSLDVKSVKPQARVGIATGLVVVGDLIGEGSAREQSVVGETPNLAARLQSLAEPDAVVIAAGTRRLVADLFEYRDLGALEMKGITGSVPAWQVLRPSAVASRFEALHGSALTPLVGREEEVDLLLRRWARAKAGEGQIVLISGEPGIGKSRITAAVAERLRAEQHLRLRYFCSPYHRDSALYPFIDQLGRAAGFAREDLPAARLEKLESMLARAAPPDEDMALVADLLSLPSPERHPLPNLSPQRKKEKTLEALLRQLEALARHRPVLMVFEDAHWIDPTSRDLLDLTVERVRGLPMLLIVTFRSEFQPPWTGQPQVTMLALSRLDQRERTVLAMRIAGGKALPDEVVAQIVDHTDGVPLFVEELTKSILESGLLRAEGGRYVLDHALPPFMIPTTLHASLLARLDRLASVRLVAQIGAAIGREFSYWLLHYTCQLPEGDLREALDRLVASELVFQRGNPPDAVYSFKHALVQDAAHSSLLRSTRQQLHARIAEALEAQSPEVIESQPDLLAQHYAEAGLNEKAVDYWVRAGKQSVVRSAMSEAEAQFEKALACVSLLPETGERTQRELEVQSSLGSVRLALSGFAAPHVARTYARARDLWEQLDCPPEFVQVPWGQVMYHVNRGDLARTQELSQNLLELAEQRGKASAMLPARLCMGGVNLCCGNFRTSRFHLEEGDRINDPTLRRALIQPLGIDPYVMVLQFLSLVLCFLGYPNQAVVCSTKGIDEAREGNHRPSLAMALAVRSRLLACLGDHRLLAESANELFDIAVEQGFPYWRTQAAIYQGWLEVASGNVGDGLLRLREAAAAFRRTGAELWTPIHDALDAKAEALLGHPDMAINLLDDALQSSRARNENWFEAELVRYRGELLRDGDSTTAEAQFREALDIARRQEAKLWELRAAISLARLRRDKGRRAQARHVLAPVYAWFTEGFDAPDLKEAKALLDEL
jgi:class 3 adenylate cyclase/predicted ATPase